MAASLVRLNLPRPALRASANDESYQFSIIRGEAPQVFQPTGRTVRIQGWERHPVVSSCVRAIVELVQSVPLEVYRRTTEGEEVVLTRHPALALFQAPRFAMNGRRLLGLTALHYALYGNGFWVLERAGTRIIAIRLLHPEDVQYAYLDDRYQEIIQYEWRDRNAERHVSPVEDVIHFADLAGGDWLFGYPRAASALKDLLADGEASDYVRQVITNDGGPTTLLGVAETVRQEEARAAEARWRERTIERGERGQLRIMPGLANVTRLGFDLSELEFPDARRIAGERICAVFGVDPRIIGLSSAAKDGGLSGEQYREARFRLIQQSVLPLMKALEGQLNLWLMPEFGDVYARFSPSVLSELTEDEAATSTRVLAEVTQKVRTVEEARQAIGLDDQAKGTDHLVSGPTWTTVAEADAPPEPVAPASPAGGPPITRALVRSVLLTPTQRGLLWRAFDDEARHYEEPFAEQCRAQFAREGVSVHAVLATAHRADPEPANDSLLDRFLRRIRALYLGERAAFREEWGQLSEPVVRDILTSAANELSASVGVDFHLEVPKLDEAIASRVNRLTGSVTETTYEAIKAAVITGREQQLSTRAIADLISETVFGGQANDRSLTIARTETVGALNHGNYLAATESGILKYKAWLGQGDNRMRDTHADLDDYFAGGQKRLPIGDRFANGLLYPGDQAGDAAEVINCRCTLLYYAGDAA